MSTELVGERVPVHEHDIALQLRGISRSFPGARPVQALSAIDLTVRRGEHLSIVGPSGSGKSTLLNVLGLLDRPSSGTYSLWGAPTEGLSEQERARLRASTLGFVFQSFYLLPGRTALENVLLASIYSEGDSATRVERARAALERVGLAHRLNHLPTTLSGGERQRVAIARAISTGSSILLADEPTGNLDEKNTLAILELFDELRAESLTLVVITHDAVVAQRGTRVVRIVDGRMSS